MTILQKSAYSIGGIIIAYVVFCLLYKDILVIETDIKKAVCMNKNL